MVWALDRLTREGVLETFEHIRKLTNWGVQFESCTEPHFRTTGPAGELMLAVAAWTAKQERVRLSERVIAGLERARKAGRIGGRPKRIVDRRKLAAMRASGLGYGAIGKKMGLPKSTVVSILKREAA